MRPSARARARAKACARKSAGSRWKGPRGSSAARSIRARTLACWTSWRPRSRVAERATIARPYAKAAFEYAKSARAFGEWSRGLELAAQIVADPRVAELAKDPELTAAQVADFVIDVAGSRLNTEMQNFVRVLTGNRRLLLLREIVRSE